MRSAEEYRIPALAGRLWLLGALVLAVSPHLLRLPVWLAAGCVAVIVWRVARELKGWRLPGQASRVILTLLAVASVGASYLSLLGREAGVALLTVMLCLKLLEMRTVRDAMLVVFLGYFLVVGTFLFSQSIFVGAYMFGVVVALTAALVALTHAGADLGQSRRYLSIAGALLAQSIPMMLLMFVLFPRIAGPLWSLPDDAYSGNTGLSDEMTIGNINNLADSSRVAFRVQFSGEPPDAGKLYWRGPVLWHTDGTRWTRLSDQESAALSAVDMGHGAGHPVEYSITLEPHGKRWLFALDLPDTLPHGTPGGAAMLSDYQLLSGKPVGALLRYTMSSQLAYNTGPAAALEKQLALELPPGANPRTRTLAQQWLAQGLSDRQIVDRALDYFRREPFYYTRQPPLLKGDPVDRFLFESRRGFCEHYAASFTTLMRAAGIPSRVVTGYQGGELNPMGDYLIVRQSDAHAWSEVWLPRQGWVRIDPTAVIPPGRIEAAPDMNRFRSISPFLAGGDQAAWFHNAWRGLKNSWDAVNHEWNQWVLGFGPERQADLLRKLGLDGNWRTLVGALVLLVGIFFGAVAAWLLLRRRQPAMDPAGALYRTFCRRLERKGLTRGDNEGPRDFATRVLSARPELAPQVDEITGLYTRLRYGRHHGTGDLVALRRKVKVFRA